MGIGISYMGTKRELALTVSEVVATCQPGPILDVFSGMCSVGEAVAPIRQVWTNDVQVFAFQVAQALFTSQEYPLRSQVISDGYYESFFTAYRDLSIQYKVALEAEEKLLNASNFDDFEHKRRHVASMLNCCHQDVNRQRHHLFSKQYSDTFIGVRQALEVDAITAAIDFDRTSETISDCARWLTVALGRSMLRVSNSTGHFAQYLTPKPGNYKTFQRQRKRRIWKEWLEANDDLDPVGDTRWRKNNKVFNQDSLMLLPALLKGNQNPAVIYADPPYTNDQYSRYYHLLETLFLYDYPSVTGKGLYRTDRFSTSFSLKAKSANAMNSLIESAARLGAEIS